MEHEVKVGQRQAALVMSKRVPVRLAGIGEVMGSAFGEVYGYLGTQGIEPAGEPFVIYHGMPEADLPFDIELCAPIGRPTDETLEGWRVQELPAGTFATLVHVGPYDTIGRAYETMGTWIEARGLETAGPPREVYLSPPDTPPERIRTVVEIPVVEAVAPARTR